MGRPLLDGTVTTTTEYDPAIFRDEDGEYYIVFGGPSWAYGEGCGYFIARLAEDMISLAETPRRIELDHEGDDKASLNKMDGRYYLSFGGVYGVPSDCRNIDAVCALMEALAADSHINVMPVYYDQVLKGKYARDTVSGQILDIIHDHPVADFAYINGYGFNTNIRYICNSTGTNTYVSEINSVLKMKKKELDNLIKMVENNG